MSGLILIGLGGVMLLINSIITHFQRTKPQKEEKGVTIVARG